MTYKGILKSCVQKSISLQRNKNESLSITMIVQGTISSKGIFILLNEAHAQMLQPRNLGSHELGISDSRCSQAIFFLGND